MPTEIEATVERGAAHLARTVREHSGLYLTEGIILVLLGILALIAPLAAALTAAVLFGWILLASGIVDLVLAVLLLVGLPGSSLWVLGLLIAINLIYGGIALIAIALHARRAASAVVH